MTHLPDPVYPEDVEANHEWFGNITDHYYECDEPMSDCPDEKHYHPKAVKAITEAFRLPTLSKKEEG